MQSFDSRVCIGKSRGYCRSRATHHLSGWWPYGVCGVAVWGGRYKWFWRKHTVGEWVFCTTQASHVTLGTTMSLTTSYTHTPRYINARSNPGSIYSRINVTGITWTLKTFYFEDFGFLKPFQPGYKLYKGKMCF